MIGTTKPTVNAVRSRSHWNSPNIRPQHPVTLGLCSTVELNEAMEKARARNPQPVAPQYEGPDDHEDDANTPADRFAMFTGGLTGGGGESAN